MEINYGFIPDTIKDEDYVLGAYTKLSALVLQPDGQWDNFLPVKELQHKHGLETSNCVCYGVLNAIECLYKRLFNNEMNYSDRYIGVLSETTPQGNSVQKVLETIRKEAGLIPEKLLPFSEDINTWEEYYSPSPMAPELLLFGKNWLLKYRLLHEWVFGRNDRNKLTRLKSGLRYSPIGVSVAAWFKNSEGLYYKPEGTYWNHWVTCYGFVEGKYWKIYDSYDNTKKKLVWDYPFGSGKRYSLTWRPITESTKSHFAWNGLMICRIIKEKLLEMREKIKKQLGKMLMK